MSCFGDVDAMDKATEAALKAGAAFPEAVAEYIQDKLTTVRTMAGPQVFVQNGMEVESLDVAMARLKATENVSVLFTGDKPNVKTLQQGLYEVIRKHAPTLVNLRAKKKGRP